MRLLILAFVALASPAFASSPHIDNGSCQGNCPNWYRNGDVSSVDGGPARIANVGIATSKADASSSSRSQASALGGNAAVGDVTNAINFDSPVATAYAAALTASAGTCMGSGSIGGQGVGFGLSVGRTWSDRDCNIRRYSAQLMSLGEVEAAIQLLCLNEDVRAVLPKCQPK